MQNGTVTFFHDEKGYGFIEPADEGEDDDVFFHISEVAGSPDTVEEGAELAFAVEPGDEGPRAVDVEIE